MDPNLVIKGSVEDVALLWIPKGLDHLWILSLVLLVPDVVVCSRRLVDEVEPLDALPEGFDQLVRMRCWRI